MHLHPAIASSWSRWVQRMLAYRMGVLGLHFVAWPSEMSCIRSVAAAGVAFLTPQHSFAHTHMSCSWKGHGLPLHPASHMGMGMCVCVCVSGCGCAVATVCVRTLFLFLCASAFPLRRHWNWYDGRQRILMHFRGSCTTFNGGARTRRIYVQS